jgi:glucose-1-phosphate cytidylyltransferase
VNIIKNYFKNSNKKTNESWSVRVINTGKNSNTGERLKRVKKYISNTFCLTYGDGLSNINIHKLIQFHKKNKSTVTLTAVKPTPHFGKITFKGNKVSKFLEKDKRKENWINGGFFVCEKYIFQYLNTKNPIFESIALNYLAQKNKLAAYKHLGFWYCMDTLRDKRHLNSLWLSKKAPWRIWRD